MKRTNNPVLDALREWPGLRGQSDDKVAELSQLLDLVELEAGRVLMHEGDVGREVFMIVDGAVDITVGDERVATLGPGHFVGEMALLEHDVRSATARTIVPTRALVAASREFYSLIREPAIAANIAVDLAHRVRRLESAPTLA
jgi:CRP/FNR family cyclic AMP-dependent transcriptional regulator